MSLLLYRLGLKDHLTQRLAGVGQVLAGIEVIRMLDQVLADHGGEGDAQVAVDVDLADGHGSSLAQLFFGNANGVGHFAAVFVDDLHEILLPLDTRLGTK